MIAWATTIFIGALALLMIGANWAGMLGAAKAWKDGQPRSFSPIPLIGGALGAIALASAPVDSVRDWFWLPALLDPGTGLFVIIMTGANLGEAWKARAEKRRQAAGSARVSADGPRARALTGSMLGIAIGGSRTRARHVRRVRTCLLVARGVQFSHNGRMNLSCES